MIEKAASHSIVIRPAELGDELAVARVHVRAWQAGYRGLMSDGYLKSLRAEDRAKRYTFGDVLASRPRTLVAVESALIVGFATVAPAEGGNQSALAELNALYVDPDYWKRGVGAMLESAARTFLAERGYRNAMLWVLAGNVRAIGFYESQGWKSNGIFREAEVWGAKVTEIRFDRAL
jgi:GNAT superfamily N-acetyltransferase